MHCVLARLWDELCGIYLSKNYVMQIMRDIVKNDFYCLPISRISHHNNNVWMSKPSGKSYHCDVGSHKRNVII